MVEITWLDWGVFTISLAFFGLGFRALYFARLEREFSDVALNSAQEMMNTVGQGLQASIAVNQMSHFYLKSIGTYAAAAASPGVSSLLGKDGKPVVN